MLNLDLTQYNPIQSDSQYANVPLPSAHLVVIEESEMKESVKDGFSKGTNILLELTILASSTGNDFVGEKLALYIPYAGFEDTAIKAGMKRLSTLAHTLGLGSYLQTKEDLHGQNFIVVLDKQKNSNFANYRRILRADGMEIADASGNFKLCELKDIALQVELDKLIDIIQSGVAEQQQAQSNPMQGQTQQGFGQQPNMQQQHQGGVMPANQNGNAQSFTPQFGQQAVQGDTMQTNATTAQSFGGQQPPQNNAVAPQPNFGSQPQQGFGQPQNNAGAWGQAVNPNNGQQA